MRLKRIDDREPTFGWGQVHDGRHGQWCNDCNAWRHDGSDNHDDEEQEDP